MEMVLKTCGSVLSIIVLFVSALAFSISNAAEVNTNNYFENVSKAVIESNYNETIIDKLVDDAEERGHTLIIEVYSTGIAGEKNTQISV